MKTRILLSAIISTLILFMSGCGAKKALPTDKPREVSTKETRKMMRTMNASKVIFSFDDEKNKNTMKGSMKIARDSAIICSFMPFPGMEFARIKVENNGLTAIDRINKRFIELPFDTIKTNYAIAIDYNAIEAILTNRLFIYSSTVYPDWSDFKVADIAGQKMLTRTDSINNIVQEFTLDAQDRLTSGAILFKGINTLRWTYSQWGTFKVGEAITAPMWFPYVVTLTFNAIDNTNKHFTIQYDNLEFDVDKKFEFKIPSSYSKVTFEEIMQLLN